MICSGSGPPRTPVSSASIPASWSAVSSKSKTSKAYHAKYDRHGPAIVGTVTGAHAVGETLRLNLGS